MTCAVRPPVSGHMLAELLFHFVCSPFSSSGHIVRYKDAFDSVNTFQLALPSPSQVTHTNAHHVICTVRVLQWFNVRFSGFMILGGSPWKPMLHS